MSRETAIEFARRHHAGQTDKAGAPYIEHCIAVASFAAGIAAVEGCSPSLIGYAFTAGLLHDVVEDTAATLEDVERAFGDEIARPVGILTKSPDCPRSQYLARCAADPIARLVKMADAYHNSDVTRFKAPTRQQIKRCEAYYLTYQMLQRHGFKRLEGGSEWATDETARGFAQYSFKDRYGKGVRLQESSLATEPCIWIFPEVEMIQGQPFCGAHLTPAMARDVARRLTGWADAQPDMESQDD